MSYFPVHDWLRVATAFIKHWASMVTKRWGDEAIDAYHRLAETMTRVCEVDPVGRDWCMNGNETKVWVNASFVAMGVVLEANGSIVKDTCWLCPTNYARHINLAKLDAALKDINLTLQWQVSVAFGHRFCMCTAVAIWHYDWEGTCKYEGSWRNASETVLRNTAGIGRRVYINYKCNTCEILSKSHRLPH